MLNASPLSYLRCLYLPLGEPGLSGMHNWERQAVDDANLCTYQLHIDVARLRILTIGRLVIHAGSSVTKEHSEKEQIKAVKCWNGGSISSFTNAEMRLFTKRTVT